MLQEIDFETLQTMSDADLKSVGVTLFGPRRKIVSGLKKVVRCWCCWRHMLPLLMCHLHQFLHHVPHMCLRHHTHSLTQIQRYSNLGDAFRGLRVASPE